MGWKGAHQSPTPGAAEALRYTGRHALKETGLRSTVFCPKELEKGEQMNPEPAKERK